MRIAVTGGICDGKSTVLGMIAERGFSCHSADEIAEEIANTMAADGRLVKALGEKAVVNGLPNRHYIRDRVLSDPEFRHKVNDLLHAPTIAEVLARTLGAEVHFVEMPLLIETATQGLFDQVWVVVAGAEFQKKRLVERVGSEEIAERLIAIQLPTEVKIAFANQIQRTDLPFDTVRLQVEKRLQELA